MISGLRLEQFMRKVEVTEGCWFWKAAINNRGYGIFDGMNAHRVSFEQWNHPIPKGMEIDHLCRVRHCVRPDHLRVVTHAENMAKSRFAMQTHCKRGHSLLDFYKNKRTGGKGYSRACKVCHAAAMKRYYKKRKARYR